MESNIDIDDLLAEINNATETKTKAGKKKKNNPVNPTQIVQSFEDKAKITDGNSILDKENNDNEAIVKTIDQININPDTTEGEKKKKKRRKKKKTENKNEEDEKDESDDEDSKKPLENKYRHLFNFSQSENHNSRFQDNSAFRVIKNWDDKPWNQTNLPTKDVEQQYPNEDFPVGQIMDYGSAGSWRTNNEEMKERERLMLYDLKSLRKAAEAHRQTRKFAQQFIRPGIKLMDICNKIENMNRFLINANGLERGIGFPTGCSINHVAAHYTPNPGDTKVLGKDDVCKIDFGTHVNGLIIDTAFTVAFNPMFDDLLLAVQDATDTGLKEAGIDVRLGDIGAAIQEVMESYEVVINGKTYPVKSVKNLCGHTIEPYKIHAGKSVPIVKRQDNTKMEEGELYAIETFGSTGKGYIYEDSDCSHYMKDYHAFNNVKIRNEKAKALFNHINRKYSTLAFCRKWLEEDGFANHSLALKYLCDNSLVNPYPPLSDIQGSYVAQFEHTVFLKPTGKEILSRGDDY